MIGTIFDKKNQLSNYQPGDDVRELTAKIQQDYHEGVRILNRSWTELNDRSVIEDENNGQLMFNAYVDTGVTDPNEGWKWRGTRSKARNKGIAMHAQLTANFLIPLFVAQNENDEVDKDYSEVMRELVEWLAQPCNSNYQKSFLQVAFGMMYNPVTYMGAEFFRVMQDIKEETADGKFSKKEVMDEVLSGFQAPLYSSSQILISNAYERNLQRQKAITEVLYKSYDEMEAKYRNHPNFEFVKRGTRSIYNQDDGKFYDVKDDDHPNLVPEEIYKNRREDLEVPFVGGIYLGDPNVDANPMKHRDHRNRPKYNKVPFGYTRIGEHFFYYKSMMNALQWDDMAYDAMDEVIFNRAMLETEIPVAISGVDKVDSNVIFPNAVIALENTDSKVTPLLPPSNLQGGIAALREREASMEEGSSINKTTEGQLPEASQKAFNVAQATANARKIIGSIGKSLGESMIAYGDLMKDIILNHVTIPQVEELVGGEMKMKYKTFILDAKEGKSDDRKIEFDESLIGLELTEDEKMEESLKLLEKSDWPKKKPGLKRVNPSLFAKHRFLTKIDLEEMFTKNNEFMQPLLLGLRAQMIDDPFTDHEEFTRMIYHSFFQSEGEKLMKENSQQIPGLPQIPAGGPPQPQPTPIANNVGANQVL